MLISLCFQGLAEVFPCETPVAEMKRRADQRIPDSMYGGEGWAMLVPRPTNAFPEKVKEFLREKFEAGEASATNKVSSPLAQLIIAQPSCTSVHGMTIQGDSSGMRGSPSGTLPRRGVLAPRVANQRLLFKIQEGHGGGQGCQRLCGCRRQCGDRRRRGRRHVGGDPGTCT